MGRIWMPGGGGGADLDVITAGAGDVLSGKVIVDQDGNPITGTIPVKSAIASSINCGGSVDIPAGYYPTAGKVQADIPPTSMGPRSLVVWRSSPYCLLASPLILPRRLHSPGRIRRKGHFLVLSSSERQDLTLRRSLMARGGIKAQETTLRPMGYHPQQ